MNDKKASVSQRLYQVYYLGERVVDRRYSSTVIPWIIEELKLNLERAQDLRRAWLTQGERSIVIPERSKDVSRRYYKRIDYRWARPETCLQEFFFLARIVCFVSAVLVVKLFA